MREKLARGPGWTRGEVVLSRMRGLREICPAVEGMWALLWLLLRKAYVLLRDTCSTTTPSACTGAGLGELESRLASLITDQNLYAEPVALRGMIDILNGWWVCGKRSQIRRKGSLVRGAYGKIYWMGPSRVRFSPNLGGAITLQL